jgi:hypothetical protein
LQILFLNKKDLFAEKMEKFPIKNYFPDYQGGDRDVAAGLDYFKRRCVQLPRYHSISFMIVFRFLRVYTKSTARQPKPDPSTTAAKSASKDKHKGKGKEQGKEQEKGRGKEKELDNEKGKGKELELGKGKGKEREKVPEQEKGKEKEKVKGSIQVPTMQRRAVYTHFTTATDTMQLRMMMVAVCE